MTTRFEFHVNSNRSYSILINKTIYTGILKICFIIYSQAFCYNLNMNLGQSAQNCFSFSEIIGYITKI